MDNSYMANDQAWLAVISALLILPYLCYSPNPTSVNARIDELLVSMSIDQGCTEEEEVLKMRQEGFEIVSSVMTSRS